MATLVRGRAMLPDSTVFVSLENIYKITVSVFSKLLENLLNLSIFDITFFLFCFFLIFL